ncbi:hypothetical protein [Pelagibacterium luteolum]|uniref:Uncharacterized protein n=1 Tax=Pelagibacterium luteolum TaxID=440168 RepID=A0A1G7Y2D5_9HYPH|nr:hypothetical protein [Pelagibacterium luteolum]SDG90544.1 hypothetical protein SAMN04487974_11211 [Pelagibacterium luteolum]
MASDHGGPPHAKSDHRSIPRTSELCELYLGRLALVVERAGQNASAFIPIARRLERELAEAKAEAEVLTRLRKRQTPPPPQQN